jgi:hypothetical protein
VPRCGDEGNYTQCANSVLGSASELSAAIVIIAPPGDGDGDGCGLRICDCTRVTVKLTQECR